MTIFNLEICKCLNAYHYYIGNSIYNKIKSIQISIKLFLLPLSPLLGELFSKCFSSLCMPIYLEFLRHSHIKCLLIQFFSIFLLFKLMNYNLNSCCIIIINRNSLKQITYIIYKVRLGKIYCVYKYENLHKDLLNYL